MRESKEEKKDKSEQKSVIKTRSITTHMLWIKEKQKEIEKSR